MVNLSRHAVVITAAFLCGCQTPVATSVPIPNSDRSTKSYGDNTDCGPRIHYVHIVRDKEGKPKDIYRYYLDEQGRPVLDGLREIRRWQHDAGHLIEYRDGRIVREYNAIITG